MSKSKFIIGLVVAGLVINQFSGAKPETSGVDPVEAHAENKSLIAGLNGGDAGADIVERHKALMSVVKNGEIAPKLEAPVPEEKVVTDTRSDEYCHFYEEKYQDAYVVTSLFGERPNPFGGGGTEFHDAVDTDLIVNVDHPKLQAVTDGKIELYQGGAADNYLKMVFLHGDDGRSYRYAHLHEFSVTDGQEVDACDTIGLQGTTGRSTGSHLDLAVIEKDGPDKIKMTDPTTIFPEWLRQHKWNTGLTKGGWKEIKPEVNTTEFLSENVGHNEAVIIAKAVEMGVERKEHVCYMLATAKHETQNFYLLSESGDPAYFDKYEPHTKTGKVLGNDTQGDGMKYKGRGYAMLTGKGNYARFGAMLGYDFVNNPDLISENTEIAAEILVYGMLNGEFAQGSGLDSYINDQGVDYHSARKIVNGSDQATKIANYAIDYCNLI